MDIKIKDVKTYEGEITNRCPRCDGPVFWSEDEVGSCMNCGEEVLIDYKDHNGES